eukprot:7772812-Pyramimonas_sp.AAC.1
MDFSIYPTTLCKDGRSQGGVREEAEGILEVGSLPPCLLPSSSYSSSFFSLPLPPPPPCANG